MPGNGDTRRRLLLCACFAINIGLHFAVVEVQANEAQPLLFSQVPRLELEIPSTFLQDRQGFIWVASANGLYRHDGYRTVHFQHNASAADSLPNNAVSHLLQDKHGRLWVATHNGLARFEAKSGGFTRFSPSPAADGSQQNRLIRGIVDDGQDGLWLATRAGLQHFNPETGQFTHYRHEPNKADSLSSDNVSVLARDGQNGLWVATWPSGLAYLAQGSEHFQHHPLNCAPEAQQQTCNVRALLVDSRQRLWIGTDRALFRWQSGTPWASRERMPLPSVGKETREIRVFSIIEDLAGQIWVGTREAGLLRWDEGQNAFLRYSHHIGDSHSLPGDAVTAVFVDRSSALWVGTQSGGVSRSDLASQGIERILPQRLDPAEFKAGNLVGNFAEETPGRLWLGGGLGKLTLVDLAKRKKIRSVGPPPGQSGGLSRTAASHLYQQPGGPLWIATNGGLARLAPGSEHWHIKSFDGPGNNSINVIAPGKGGVLWLGTGGGVIRYAPKSDTARFFRHIPGDPPSLGAGANSTLVEEASGHLWVGGGEQAGARGLCILDPASGRCRHYRHDSQDNTSLSSDIVNSIHRDGRGHIWLGTSAGLNRAQRAADGAIHFIRTAVTQPVSSVNSDLANNIWARIPGGLLRLDAQSGEIRTFAASEGAPEGTPIEAQSFRSEDGTLYFGSLHGFSRVVPQEIRQNTTAPQAAITDISVFNHSLLKQPATDEAQLEGSVSDPQRLQLSWKASVFTLELAALHYADPTRNRLAYRLDGFDQNWVEVAAGQRMATYTNLDPGEYLFRVKAASSNGVWSEHEVRLPISIVPPFWKTTLFKIALLLAVLLLPFVFYRWRVKQLLHNQMRLEQLVEQRTQQLVEKDRAKTRFLASASHDLRQPIQAITLFVGVLKQSEMKEAQSNIVRHLDASVQALRGLLGSLLDISKLDAGAIVPVWQTVSLNGLMQTLALELSPLAVDKKLRFILFCPQREIILYTDAQLLKQALQNLLANAITYTERGGVLFAARRCGEQRQQVSIEIWDTGIGIGADEQSRIFDEFYQVANPQRDRKQGLGLGLSIVKRTLTLLHLPISCRSRVGRGSVFATRARIVPIEPSAALTQQASATDVPQKRDQARFVGKRFIVVEDDEQAANALRTWLQTLGGKVIVYMSADSALADRQNVYSGDYYISDFRLPGENSGLDFLKIIRARQPVPCVLVTGDTSSKFIEMTRQAKIPVLFKPVVPEELLRALER